MSIDMGPTYGKDYGGADYNITMWHTPPSESANHYESAAKLCEAYCDADPKCCSWTYCPPGSGEDLEVMENAKFAAVDSALGERCCLKVLIDGEGGLFTLTVFSSSCV